jgi:hypothetical protein
MSPCFREPWRRCDSTSLWVLRPGIWSCLRPCSLLCIQPLSPNWFGHHRPSARSTRQRSMLRTIRRTQKRRAKSGDPARKGRPRPAVNIGSRPPLPHLRALLEGRLGRRQESGLTLKAPWKRRLVRQLSATLVVSCILGGGAGWLSGIAIFNFIAAAYMIFYACYQAPTIFPASTAVFQTLCRRSAALLDAVELHSRWSA